MRRLFAIAAVLALAGCITTQPEAVVTTQTLDKPVPVRCQVETPAECRDSYAVDALQPGADPVQVNRAMQAEIEQRRACEVKLRAAVKGCNDVR